MAHGCAKELLGPLGVPSEQPSVPVKVANLNWVTEENEECMLSAFQPHTSGRDMRMTFAPRYHYTLLSCSKLPPQNPTPIQTSLPGLSTKHQMALCIPQCYRMTTHTVEFSHHLLSHNTTGCQDTVHQCCFLHPKCSKLQFRGHEQ